MADPIFLHVLVEDQPGVAAALLEAAGPARTHEVHAQTGGFLVPADIAGGAGLVPADDSGDVKAPAARTARGVKAGAKADEAAEVPAK